MFSFPSLILIGNFFPEAFTRFSGRSKLVSHDSGGEQQSDVSPAERYPTIHD